MAKNIQSLQLLRNTSVLYANRAAALAALTGGTIPAGTQDGTPVLARYKGTDGKIYTLVGYYADSTKISGTTTGETNMTVFDFEGSAADVKELKDMIGTGVTTANTVTKQLQDLSGTTADTSATTSVEGAKKYADYKVAEELSKLTATTVAGDSKIVSDVTQANGKITTTAKNVTEVKLAGLSATADTKIAATDTLGDALAKLQGQIDGMDKAAEAVDGQVVTTVTEADGKVTETKANVKDLQLGGYAKSASATGDIASTDTINTALSKLENKVGANKITNADHSIVVTEPTGTATTTDIKVNIKSGEKVIKLDNNGIYTDIKLSAITVSDTNVKEAWGLFTGTEQLGSTIKIYKDSAYKEIYLGTSADTIDATTGKITKQDGDKQSLNYAYMKADGTYDLVKVDVSAFLSENEFQSGVTVTNHIVHGVVDSTSEKDSNNNSFLTVGASGFKVSGVKDEIDAKINALDATGGTQTIATDKHVAVEVIETDGKITTVTVNETNIADADDLAALSAKAVTEVASSNESITAALSAATDGTKHLDIITDASKIKMSGFTADTSGFTQITESSSIIEAFKAVETYILENEETVSAALTDLEVRKAEKTDLNNKFNELDNKIKELSGGTSADLAAEIAARKAVDGINGDTYTATSTANYINNATSLNDADQKLDAVIKKNELTVASSSQGAITLNPSDTGTTIALGYLDAGTY